MPAILVASGPRAGTRVEVTDGLEIGRSAGCGIRIHDDRASRVHARVLIDEGEVILEDLGSRNGTLLNGERATGRNTLRPGDRIRIGRTFFVYEPRTRLHPARFSGGLLLLDDEIAVVESEPVGAERPGRRWEDELRAASSRLQAMRSEMGVAGVLAEEAMRLVHARGVAVLQVDDGSGAVSPMVIVGLPGIALPATLLRETLDERRLVQKVVDRGPSRAVRDQEHQPATRARLLLAPIVDARGAQGLILAECNLEEESPRAGAALATLAALGGLALSGVAERERCRLQADFLRRGIDPESPTLLGDSAALRGVAQEVLRISSGGGALWLKGEPGTGRTLLACLAHERHPGAARPLGLFSPRPGSDPAAVLFGSEGGESIVPGLLERCRGGSCVVRGFAGLPVPLQRRLLEVIEQGTGVREAGQRPVDLPTRLILLDEQGEGAPDPPRAIVRRLKAAGVSASRVPPLRERDLDVGGLFEAFLRAEALSRGREVPSFGPAVHRALRERRWPGNLLELQAFAAAALRATPRGEPLVLPSTSTEEGESPSGGQLSERVEALEVRAIRAAMEAEGGRKARVARRLGISRPTLDRKLRRYDL
ncbi:MAG: FHA domain-containing protein [Deltaproteobacteria bacterium]|nr:FHA domain-containing protein [Deltaproteobacteria bacterium]